MILRRRHRRLNAYESRFWDTLTLTLLASPSARYGPADEGCQLVCADAFGHNAHSPSSDANPAPGRLML